MSRRRCKRRTCNHCGQPKHLIYLEHNTYVKRRNKLRKFLKRVSYNSKKCILIWQRR